MQEIEVKLPVLEHFYSLQGEGANQGKPCYFIRLSGCNVGCFWCDVKESWDVAENQWISLKELLPDIKNSSCTNIIITGGEPSLYDLTAWTNCLKQHDYKIFLETAATEPIKGNFDWVCISPKKFKPALNENLLLADELKIIIRHKSDLLWAEGFKKFIKPDTALFLQPEWENAAKITPEIIDYIKTHPEWRLSLQVHKYLNIR
ncbi:MAG: 7-carboxy-7-deazaguanine synthase QueE [Sediminibacterium sp.]|nr:7-carboxy-7-deazaguanine synthase QueE [Sediminibacterium sp.]